MHSQSIFSRGAKHSFKRHRCATLAGLLVLSLLSLIGCTQSDKPPTQSANPSPTNAVAVKKEGNYITANPNPVPAGPGHGTTTVVWRTVGIPAQEVHVYVAGVEGKENLFSTGSEGSQTAPWIGSDSLYEFRLYSGSGANRKLLDKVVVTRDK